MIVVHGLGPATKYTLSPQAHVTMPLDIDTYFKYDIHERQMQEAFNFQLIKEILPEVSLFTDEEMIPLNRAQQMFHNNISDMSDLEYRKEMDRHGVDLSWKSSKIEGNTYFLS